MNDQNNNLEEFDENGSRPNDMTDGIAITAIFTAIITGILYYIYTM